MERSGSGFARGPRHVFTRVGGREEGVVGRRYDRYGEGREPTGEVSIAEEAVWRPRGECKISRVEGWRVSSVRSLNGLWASLSGLPSRTDLTYLSLYILLRFLSSDSAIIRGIIYFFFEKILFSFRDYSI